MTSLPLDTITPFTVSSLGVRGRVVKLGHVLDGILSRHRYPVPVSHLLGQAIGLTALIGTSLKFEGRLTLQTQSDGAVSMLVVDFTAPDKIRACARFDAEAVMTADTKQNHSLLLGKGHLALTIDQGPHMERYQGIVMLDKDGLEDAAHRYFLQSEQIPTRVSLAVSELVTREQDPQGAHYDHHWCGGGLLVQHLPETGGTMHRDLDPGTPPQGALKPNTPEANAWIETSALVQTLTAEELTDPALSAERLIWRLFNEHDPRVFEAKNLIEKCRCSRDGLLHVMQKFSADDKQAMVENNKITATCEFCSTAYVYSPEELNP